MWLNLGNVVDTIGPVGWIQYLDRGLYKSSHKKSKTVYAKKVNADKICDERTYKPI